MSLCFYNSILYFFPSPPSKSIFMLWFCVDHLNTQSKLSSAIEYVVVCKTRAWEWGQLDNDCCHQCRGECLRYEPCQLWILRQRSSLATTCVLQFNMTELGSMKMKTYQNPIVDALTWHYTMSKPNVHNILF